MGSVLIVGAHALDAEVMAGAVAAGLARRGFDAVLLHLTRGERGYPRKPAPVFGRQLEQEMAAAARALGVRQEWPGFAAPLPSAEEVAPAVADAIRRFGAQLVLTHWQGSWHPSHVRAHEAVLAAIRGLREPPAVLYGENCEDLTGFQPDYFAPIDDVYESWLEALRSYELFRLSEPGSSESEEVVPYWAYYTAAVRVRGLQSGLGRAQALMAGPGAVPDELGFRSLEALATAAEG